MPKLVCPLLIAQMFASTNIAPTHLLHQELQVQLTVPSYIDCSNIQTCTMGTKATVCFFLRFRMSCNQGKKYLPATGAAGGFALALLAAGMRGLATGLAAATAGEFTSPSLRIPSSSSSLYNSQQGVQCCFLSEGYVEATHILNGQISNDLLQNLSWLGSDTRGTTSISLRHSYCLPG